MDLSGTWRFAVDRNNEGISAQWYLQTLNDQVQLPGSMITNGKGDPVSLTTPWVGSFNDQTFSNRTVMLVIAHLTTSRYPIGYNPTTIMLE